jgi:integrase
VVTSLKDRKSEVAKEFATAHDLGRSINFRWFRRVMPAMFKELMRHSDIGATTKFYVGVNAEATADELWRAVEKPLGTQSGTKVAEAGVEPARELPPTGF